MSVFTIGRHRFLVRLFNPFQVVIKDISFLIILLFKAFILFVILIERHKGGWYGPFKKIRRREKGKERERERKREGERREKECERERESERVVSIRMECLFLE